MSIFSGFWDGIDKVITPIHPEGFKFAFVFGALAVITALLFDNVSWIFILLTCFVLYFFRDPERVVPLREGLIIAPADGKISAIEDVLAPNEFGFGDAPVVRISTFLSVFDVHIQRAPVAGAIEDITYHKGLFLNASLDKASEDNERNSMILKTSDGTRIAVVQIAGLIARRILCFVKQGGDLGAGERYGLIRFGSRVDVYLPAGSVPLVHVGQRTLGGETVLADLKSSEEEREARAV